MLMWPLTATWHWHMVRKVMPRVQVELFFGQELGNISSYAPSGVPTEHTTSSLSINA
ncbi:hypothetical protein MTR_1g043830 [Medicago truncatula]|uniref:Uncharacterized protein n=1 Tax=Medicago truncatula TaxID=3880 RepID=G7I5H9_MEDTR|nr:hypothetical protein MTR_1g043830 [Medicago truncatula]